MISSAVLGFLILFNARLMCSSRRFAFAGWPILDSRVGSQSFEKCSFPCWSGRNQEHQIMRNWPVSTGESICESPQALALRQNRPTYTIVQSRSVPPRASPNSRSRTSPQWILATRLLGRQMRARCAQECPCPIFLFFSPFRCSGLRLVDHFQPSLFSVEYQFPSELHSRPGGHHVAVN